jgi:hypothetical protein
MTFSNIQIKIDRPCKPRQSRKGDKSENVKFQAKYVKLL